MKRVLALGFAVATMLGVGSAFAVSGGQYDPARQHCSGAANNYNRTYSEPGCYAVIATVMDAGGHEYLGVGAHQDEGFQHLFDVWVDPGLGTKYTFQIDATKPQTTGAPVSSASTSGDPTSGLWAYFGADDNVDGGEHDGAPEISNGPSDGGGLAVKISQAAATRFLNSIATTDVASLFQSPLPIETAGGGGCADGLCFPGLAAVRATIFQGGSSDLTSSRLAANYENAVFPPGDCSGASAHELAACVDDDHPNGIIDWFDEIQHDVYVLPGISIYEDPDPQASEIFPTIPALYVGSCGFIFGGGAMSQFNFSGPGTNSAHQIALLNPLCG